MISMIKPMIFFKNFTNRNNQKFLKRIRMNKMQKFDRALCKLVSNMKNNSKLELETIIKLQIFRKLSQSQKFKMLKVNNMSI